MKYVSTRGAGAISSCDAILKGIAPDGGLYVPSSFPIIGKEEILSLTETDYPGRAAEILSLFLPEFSKDELLGYAEKAYSSFDGDPAPVVKIDDDTYILELTNGPTLAFKDMALTLLPYLIRGAEEKTGSGKKTLILVATSGDTGKAAIEGFAGVEGTEIIVFYPSEGVSDMQKLQMQTSPDKNVAVVGIEGNFDDAQSAVKAFFNDPEAVKRADELGYKLSSANSINWGRLVPQIAYYISAYADLVASEEIEYGAKINFVVPTGNFGNILAAYYAKRMGLPVNKLIVASNSNNVLYDFFTTGRYDINRAFYKTASPSMDILISSNLERLIYEFSGRNPEEVKKLMEELNLYGVYDLDVKAVKEKLSEFAAFWADGDEVIEAIDNFYDMFGYLPDPHTAVAIAAYYNYVGETGDEDTKTVIVATASPFKFPSDVLEAVTGKREEDAFKAVKKLKNYTGEEAPDQIEALNTLPVLHNLVIPKRAVKETIFEILDKRRK